MTARPIRLDPNSINRLKCPSCRKIYATLVVTSRYCNHSAFNGYRETPSAYSGLKCLGCGNVWRTRANVDHLRNVTDADLGISR